jgi:hypothetical protein
MNREVGTSYNHEFWSMLEKADLASRARSLPTQHRVANAQAEVWPYICPRIVDAGRLVEHAGRVAIASSQRIQNRKRSPTVGSMLLR